MRRGYVGYRILVSRVHNFECFSGCSAGNLGSCPGTSSHVHTAVHPDGSAELISGRLLALDMTH